MPHDKNLTIQSTLSSWRKKNIFPRADDALKIARAIDTTVDYLVDGTKADVEVCSDAVFNIALKIEKLSEKNIHIVKCLVEQLKEP